MREKILPCSFTVTWVPGKTHYIADALSRYPVFQPEADHIPTEDAIVCLSTTAVNTLQCITDAITQDYLQIIEFLQSNSNQIPIGHQITPYRNIIDRLFIRKLAETTLIMLDHNRILVPTAARQYILQQLHLAHSGVVKTYRTARQLYYWPGMKNDIITDRKVHSLPAIPAIISKTRINWPTPITS